MSRSLVCPECGEPAQKRPPTASPWTETWTRSHGRELPKYSHLDGEPLCPVMGDRGYEPAEPIEAGSARS